METQFREITTIQRKPELESLLRLLVSWPPAPYWILHKEPLPGIYFADLIFRKEYYIDVNTKAMEKCHNVLVFKAIYSSQCVLKNSSTNFWTRISSKMWVEKMSSGFVCTGRGSLSFIVQATGRLPTGYWGVGICVISLFKQTLRCVHQIRNVLSRFH